jgi:predicted MPP superfamily phosphohydrolase
VAEEGRDADGPANPGRRLLLSRAAAIAAGVTAAGLTGSGVRTALGAPRINRVRIDLAKLPRSMNGLRIATVSDIHLGPLAGRAHAERVVSVINSVEADLVAVVGDLVDGTVAELGEAAEPLQDIRSRLGAFFVTGNHEYYSGAEEWVAEVERLGLRPLRNERVPIEGLDLAGVNDLADPVNAPDFDRALAGRDRSRPVVLLAHQPVLVDQAKEHGVDLQLSGHTHGGQIVPFNYVVRLAQPVVSGYARFDDTQLFVTNGAGFWGPPVRVGAPPQVTLVELRAES